MKASLKRWGQFLFFGGPTKWYAGPDATQESKAAVIEWLNDRAKLHTWITSLATGTIVFLATFGPATTVYSIAGQFKVVGFGLMLLFVTTNIVCIWSLSNWKFNVATDVASGGALMRIELEVVGWIAIISFLGGLVVAVVPVIA